MTSTIHGHVDPCHKASWLVRLQKLNGSWANIDSELTDAGSDVTFIYSGSYPATLRIYCQGGSCGGDDYDDDTAPTSSGLTFYEDQEVWFTLNLPIIPSDDPPTVSTQAATSLGWDNGTFHATLNGTVTQTGGATVVERGFDWGYSTGNYPYEVTEEGSWGTGAFSLVDNGMNAKVYFRAKARNVEGWGYGGELSFDPPPRPPSLECWTPLDLAWDNGTFHGTLDATITDTGGENADERGFDWDYDSGEPYANSWTEEGSYGLGNFDHLISGLNAKVYFRAKAHNSAGWGYSSEKSFDPPPRDPPTVTTQAADAITWENGTFEAMLHGTITNTGNGTCDRRGFDWGYSTGSYAYSWYASDGFGTGTFEHLAEALASETIYFRAKARNSEGWGYGGELSFEQPSSDAVTMIGGPTGFTWGTPTPGSSIVRITTDGGLTWAWGVATGTIVVPHGGPTSWIWKEFTFYE